MKSVDLFIPFMQIAFEEARNGYQAGHGGPFGAVIVSHGTIVGRGHNTVLKDHDPTAHAEMNAIREATRQLQTPHLRECLLVTTSEPCPMCLSAVYWAQIPIVYYGVSKDIAADYGFSDSFIYEELQKPSAQRHLKLVGIDSMRKQGEQLFNDWQSASGQLY